MVNTVGLVSFIGFLKSWCFEQFCRSKNEGTVRGHYVSGDLLNLGMCIL